MIENELNRFPHYMLPPGKQRIFASLLNYIKNGASIHMGPFLELNYSAVTHVSFISLSPAKFAE